MEPSLRFGCIQPAEIRRNERRKGQVQQRHDFICTSTIQIAEVWKEWLSGRRVREDVEGFLIESHICYGSDATRVASKDIPLGFRERSAERVLFRGLKRSTVNECIESGNILTLFLIHGVLHCTRGDRPYNSRQRTSSAGSSNVRHVLASTARSAVNLQ